jgi:hypothetical protein
MLSQAILWILFSTCGKLYFICIQTNFTEVIGAGLLETYRIGVVSMSGLDHMVSRVKLSVYRFADVTTAIQ